MTVYLDDLAVGLTYSTSRRTITEADITNFAGVSGDFNPLHVDDVFATCETPYGERIAHGLLVTAVGSGLRSDLDDWATIAYLECTRRFRRPVLMGDTVGVTYEITDVRISASRPTLGVVQIKVAVLNQKDEEVQEGVDVVMVARDPARQERSDNEISRPGTQ